MSDPIDLAQFEGHTPGPWSFSASMLEGGGCQAIDTGPDPTLGLSNWSEMATVYASDEPRGEVVAKANARLIAAAPSLLAELRTLRAADESRKRRDAAVDELVEALKMARARIQNLSEAIIDAKELGLTVAICGDEFDGNVITAALEKATALAAIKGEAK